MLRMSISLLLILPAFNSLGICLTSPLYYIFALSEQMHLNNVFLNGTMSVFRLLTLTVLEYWVTFFFFTSLQCPTSPLSYIFAGFGQTFFLNSRMSVFRLYKILSAIENWGTFVECRTSESPPLFFFSFGTNISFKW